MMLFVDDCVARHVVFNRWYPDAMQTASLIVAQSELMIPEHVSELWLDHDLGESLVNGGYFDPASNEAVGTQTDTIMPLVDWLCASSCPRLLPIRVHSWNGPAARRMALQLADAGFANITVRPFNFKGPNQ